MTPKRTQYKIYALLVALLMLIGACSNEPENSQNNSPDADVASTTDTAVDASMDAHIDTNPDTNLNTEPDTSPDARLEDAEPDTSPDATIEPDLPPLFGDNIFYATTLGEPTNDGKTEETAWDIQHAFRTAKAGHVVYIKAGNYGDINLEIEHAGTETDPIKLIGYKNRPGDILATQGSTFKYEESAYSADDYPTVQGVRTNGDVSGKAVTFKRRYVELHNFQIKDKHIAIQSFQGYNTLNNIIILDMGNHSGRHGRGILVSGVQNKVSNSFIKNAGSESLSTSGSHQIIENNWIGCDQDISDAYSCGYYLLLFGSEATGRSADHNILRNNTIYRQPGQYHQAHGLILKGSAKNNQLINNTVLNAPLEFSMDGVENNTVTGGTIKGSAGLGETIRNKFSFILIANGAHHNTFQDMTITGDVGVRFSDWDDGTNTGNDADDAGNNNLFKNINFNNLISGIEFANQWGGPGAAWDNTFEDCTFSNIKTELFRTERPNSNTVFKNCTFSNNPTTVFNQDGENLSTVPPKGVKKPLDVTFTNCTFENNGFPPPN